jgi:hypothetical protein
MKKKKPGRPKKDKDLKLGLLLQVRLSADEKASFVEAAAISGQNVSVWARDQLRRAARLTLEEVGRPVAFLASRAGE